MASVDVDYGNPLGISKKEWAKVLGLNLVILVAAYVAAMICTMCGSDFFLLDFHSDSLERAYSILKSGPNLYPLVTIAFSTIEEMAIVWYAAKKRIRWWFPVAFAAIFVSLDILFNHVFQPMLRYLTAAMDYGFMAFCIIYWQIKLKDGRRGFAHRALRLMIAIAVSFLLNGLIALLRMAYAKIWDIDLSSSAAYFALVVEYDLALVMALGFLTLVIPWEKKGGESEWATSQAVSGSSPTLTKSSPKNSPEPKRNPSDFGFLTPAMKKRIRSAKARVVVTQTIALVLVLVAPWLFGKEVEFALVFVSFSLTRMALGFTRSLHFKSELVCVTSAGALFIALSLLVPDVKASIIIALCYGSFVAIAFRLYWELHDLMLYRRASKNDRYAMMYTAFKGDVSPRHIYGVMKSKGHPNEDISLVTEYMAGTKVEAIANDAGFARITVEKRLTRIADSLYSQR